MQNQIARGLATGAIAAAVFTIGCQAPNSESSAAAAPATADARADNARNVRLVGYHDLQGRESLVVTALSNGCA